MSRATDTPQDYRLGTVSSWGVPRRRYVDSTGERSGCTTEISVLIAHSDPLISAGLAAVLRKRRDFSVVPPRPEGSAAPQTTSHPRSADIVVADYDSALRLTDAEPGFTGRVVILTHNDSEANICHALERGARGYLLLGCSVRDLLGGIRSVHSGGVAIGALVAHRIAEMMKQEALTAREEATLKEMMAGLSNEKIAQKLTVAEGTVKTFVKAIFGKLGARTRTEAVAIAQRRGILRDEHERYESPPRVQRIRVGPRTQGLDNASAQRESPNYQSPRYSRCDLPSAPWDRRRARDPLPPITGD